MPLSKLLFNLADVRCEQCQHQFRMQDLKEDDFLVCSSCGVSKPLSLRGNSKHIDYDKSLIRPSPLVQIQREGSIFIVEKKWASKFSKLAVTVAVLWNAFWITAFFKTGPGVYAADLLSADLATKILLVTSGLLLLLWALRSMLNRTRIMIKNQKMVISTSPLHWGPLKIYDIKDIESMRSWQENPKTKKPHFGFRVELNLKDGRTVTMCPALDSNEAAYIEKTVEEILLIERTPRIVDPLVC